LLLFDFELFVFLGDSLHDSVTDLVGYQLNVVASRWGADGVDKAHLLEIHRVRGRHAYFPASPNGLV